MTDDMTLLGEYTRHNSEEAFRTLVSRHVNLVYSVALRRVGNTHLAEEITQAVFIILARKAASLSSKTILAGWLCRTAHYASANALTIQHRRAQREQEAYMQSIPNESEPDAWDQIAPLLDAALAELNQKDYDAIVLRFFQGHSFGEVSRAMGASEDAAKKRVSRALEKLRKYFSKRGIVSTTAIIAGVVSANSVQAAPTALATSISAVAIAKGAAVSGSTLTLVKGALKLMAWTKAKTALVVGTGILLAAGTASVAVKQLANPAAGSTTDESWRVAMFDSRVLGKAAPQVKILPTKFPRGGGYGSNGDAWMGICTPISAVIQTAYHQSPWRTILPSDLPTEKYDYIAKLPNGAMPQDVFAALQREVKTQFGLVGRREMREVDVLFLEMKKPNAPGLVPSPSKKQGGASSRSEPGRMVSQNQPLRSVGNYLEGYFKTPVINKVELTNNFDIDLKWNEPDWRTKNPEGLKQALLDQLGLELVPGRSEIEILVVERVKD